jgi:hypothetical protein
MPGRIGLLLATACRCAALLAQLPSQKNAAYAQSVPQSPVSVSRGEHLLHLQLPPFLTDIQYIRAWEQSDPERMVERIIKALG